MFKFICLLALATSTFAASIGNVESSTKKPREIIPLVSFESENNPDGSFKFSYEGGDKSFREESAHVVDAGTEDEALEVSGSYRYIDDEGRLIEVQYTAGKNGFVPVGTNILSEITAAAKAAADLPNTDEEELKRKGRSNVDPEKKVEEVKETENLKQSPVKVEEKKSEEKTPEEKKPEEKKPEEEKVEEKKVEEKKSENA